MYNTHQFNAEWFQKDINRAKRAPMNIVGTLMKSLFGTLAQEDAEEYLQRFRMMEQIGTERQVHINQQTTLLKSAIQVMQNMNEEQIKLNEKMTNQFRVVNNSIQLLHNKHDNLWINVELQFQIENLLMFISLAITSFHNKQKQFLEAIAFGSKASAVTPVILPPKTFMDE